MCSSANCQTLPYKEIPKYPADYSAGNILARSIDGLGFRFYWASEGLRSKDLEYKPSEDGRTTFQTMQHIYGLSEMIVNSSAGKPNITADRSSLTYEQLRSKTLLNLKKASDLLLGKTAEEIEKLSVVFQSGERKNEYPYWHMINGPISDAIYHTGQLVTLRRQSGNPLNPKVNVFTGKQG